MTVERFMATSVLGPRVIAVQNFDQRVSTPASPWYRRAVERPSEPPSEPVRPRTLVIAAVVFYGLMGGVSVLLMPVFALDPLATVFGASLSPSASPADAAPLFSHPLAALLGAAAGMAVVGLSALLKRWGPMARLQEDFGQVLGDQTPGTIAVLAVASGVGEELLFRGLLLPLIGFWPTAIAFGVLHGGGVPRYFAWTVFAFLSGLLLAWLAQVTGSLLAPILCHLTVNYWNLQALKPEAKAA